jgi:hypothetical protein
VYPEVEVVLLVPGQPRPARLLFFSLPAVLGLVRAVLGSCPVAPWLAFTALFTL